MMTYNGDKLIYSKFGIKALWKFIKLGKCIKLWKIEVGWMDINLSINYVYLLFGLIEKPINYNINVIYSNDSWSLFINLILNGKFEFPRLVLVNFN
jgi:hypothetical protein